MDRIVQIFNNLINTRYSITRIGDVVNGFFSDMMNNPGIMGIWQSILNALAGFAAFIPFVLLVLALVEVFFGKKLIEIQKFLAGGIIGYCVGVQFIAPLINSQQLFVIPDYISGIVIALVLAVLSKFIYVVAYLGTAGYLTYLVVVSPEYLSFLSFAKNNLVVGLVFAAVAIIIALALRKYIEMFGTALLGGYFISKIIINSFADYRAWDFLGTYGWLAELGLILVIGIVGFIVQYKTRTRY